MTFGQRWTFTAALDGDTWTARVLRHPSQKAHVAARVEVEERDFANEAAARVWAEKQLPIEQDRKRQQRRAKNIRKKAKKQRDKEIFNMPFIDLAALCAASIQPRQGDRRTAVARRGRPNRQDQERHRSTDARENAIDAFDFRCDGIQAEIYWRHLKGGADDETATSHAVQQVPDGRKRRLALALSGDLDRVTENLQGIAIANARRIAAIAPGMIWANNK